MKKITRKGYNESGDDAPSSATKTAFNKLSTQFSKSTGAAADTLKKICHRATDCCARFGGEEFIVLSPDTTIKQGQVMADKIQEAIANLKIPHHESKVKSYLTVSIGVAVLTPRPELSVEDLIEAADKAMYQAKSAGRNQTICAPLDI